MRADIHPTYYPDAKVCCASCGRTWTTGSTKKEMRVDICSNCHPFFTGEASRILDIEGQVDRIALFAVWVGAHPPPWSFDQSFCAVGDKVAPPPCGFQLVLDIGLERASRHLVIRDPVI